MSITYWLAAIYLPGIGPRKVLHWLEHFSNMEALFTATVDEWHAAGLTAKDVQALQHPNWQAVEKDLRWMEGDGCHVVTLAQPSYPSRLKEISDPPLVLFVRGNLTALTQVQIAMVGARNATSQGLKHAHEFAHYLASGGFVITSGLALGIDGASHKGALAASGLTIGVAGTGLHHLYPSSHASLVTDIIQAKGAVISEFPLATPPQPHNFPRRNRIIAGLSVGVLVVEAMLKSGSLITARHALEQGREVFAIPGPIHHPLSRGCHYLIRQGAKLVETGADILEELGAILPIASSPILQAQITSVAPKKANLPPVCWQLLEQIGYDITANDVILLRSGLTTSEVSSILLTLELNGYIASVPGGYIRIVTNQ